ncbi:ABC-three component system middle component 7 [Alloscardovia sp. HMSC034E08]|uniref:ABC-three component system middle component 7 n=1 Tax=Alloscardovia sp. HMSC034E08 TaxID=1739413 RepID=UPI00143BE059|nr:ABC-three component system middle component 7 [Alloscardovia sp. HMSC034E08]
MPEIMRLLDHPMNHNELATQLGPLMTDPIKLIDALESLYALGRITLDEEGMV